MIGDDAGALGTYPDDNQFILETPHSEEKVEESEGTPVRLTEDSPAKPKEDVISALSVSSDDDEGFSQDVPDYVSVASKPKSNHIYRESQTSSLGLNSHIMNA